jgi:hypothetical protein
MSPPQAARVYRRAGIQLSAPLTMNTFRKSFAQNHADPKAAYAFRAAMAEAIVRGKALGGSASRPASAE